MLAIFLGLAAPAGAASDSDHDRARDAVRAGQIQPLNSILARVQSQFHGRVIGVRLVKPGRNPRQWRYRVKLLTPRGRVLLVIVNARTGNVLGVRGR